MFRYFLKWLYREAYFTERRKLINAVEQREGIIRRRNVEVALLRKEVNSAHRELKDMRHTMMIIRLKDDEE